MTRFGSPVRSWRPAASAAGTPSRAMIQPNRAAPPRMIMMEEEAIAACVTLRRKPESVVRRVTSA